MGNRCENQPGTFKVLMDSIGNLQVTSKIGTRKTHGTTTVLIGYIGNLMVGGTTDMKISLEYSKLLWIILENLQVTSKIGTTKILIGYFDNPMVGGTTDTKTSLQQTARCTEIASVVQTLFDQQLNSVKSTVKKPKK